MSHELLYTSAPKGLKSGSRGFCTVVCTQGLPTALSNVLESLSAYRHVFPAGDRNASKNPIAWSHLKMNVAGHSFHVLSRIADFGLDYSQRGNKLAHHVALDASDLASGGPALLLGQPGNMETTWDGQPRLLPARRPMREVPQAPKVCTAWQAMTGDAGWAGVLAESFLTNPEGQVYITFEPGMHVLPLIAEAITLLPVERRWDVTFSTYFTSLPPGVNCVWRCVLAGSPEAEQSRKFGKALHINLCEALPPATGGPLVIAARTGQTARPAPRRAIPTADANWTDEELASELDLGPVAEVRSANPAAVPGVHFSELAPVPIGGVGNDHSRFGGMPPVPPPLPSRKRRSLADLNAAEFKQRSKRIRWIMAGLALLLIALGVGVFAVPTSREWVLKKTPLARPTDEIAQREQPQGREAESIPKSAPKIGDEQGSKITDKAPRIVDDSKGKAVAGGGQITGVPHTITSDNSDDEPPPPKKDGEQGKERAKVASSSDRTPENRAADSAGHEKQFIPRFGSVQLVPVTLINNDVNGYELFAISLQDAVNNEKPLRFPKIDSSTVKLSLLAPLGRSDISTRRKPGYGSDLTILKKAQGNDSPPVLTIVATSANNGDCEVRFSNKAPGWEAVSWCLLSIEDADRTLHLFSLQLPTLEWNNNRFKKHDFSLPFGILDDPILKETIQIDFVQLTMPECEPLQFRQVAGTTDSSVSCTLSKNDAERIFLSDAPPLKLTVIRPRAKDSNGVMLTSLPNVDVMREHLKNRIKDELTPVAECCAVVKIERLTADLLSSDKPLEAQNSMFSKAKDSMRKDLEALQSRIDTAIANKAEPQQIMNLKRQRENIDDCRQKLEIAKRVAEAYRKFRSGLENAEIRTLSLHYDFEIDDPKDHGAKLLVPVTLKFSAPQK